MVIIVFRRSPISLQRVRKESDEEVNTGGEGDERGGEKREKEGRRMEEMRGDETEPKKTNKQTRKNREKSVHVNITLPLSQIMRSIQVSHWYD